MVAAEGIEPACAGQGKARSGVPLGVELDDAQRVDGHQRQKDQLLNVKR